MAFLHKSTSWVPTGGKPPLHLFSSPHTSTFAVAHPPARITHSHRSEACLSLIHRLWPQPPSRSRPRRALAARGRLEQTFCSILMQGSGSSPSSLRKLGGI
jgi:hypothetical protein